jgi:hypothetical protein
MRLISLESIMGRSSIEEEDPYALTTGSRNCRHHPTGAAEPVRLPLALVASLPRLTRTTTSVRPLLGLRAGHRGSRRRRRIVDDEAVEFVGYRCRLWAELSFGSAGGSDGSDRRNESCCCINGGIGGTNHCAGSASDLAACFNSTLSFREPYTPEAEFPRSHLFGISVNSGSEASL